MDIAVNEVFETLSRNARAAIEAGDVDAVRSIYANEAEFYLYFLDDMARSWEDVEPILRGIVGGARCIRFRDVRLTAMSGGFVQQHTLSVEKNNGGTGEMHGVILFRVNNAGKVLRMDEYGSAGAIF